MEHHLMGLNACDLVEDTHVLAPCRVVPHGEKHAAIIRKADREVLVVPVHLAGLMTSFSQGNSFSEKFEEYVEDHGLSGAERASLRDGFFRMLEAGWIHNDKSLLRLFRDKSTGKAGSSNTLPVETLGIPTSGRPDTLSRTLQSYAEYLERSRREVTIWVVDGSKESGVSAKYREQLRALQASFKHGIRYVGLEERKAFGNLLVSEGGFDPGLIDFALFASGQKLGAYGAGRNTLLLLQAGRKWISCDDDVLFRFATHPKRKDRIGFFSLRGPVDCFFSEDRRELEEGCRWEDVEVIGEYESVLGKNAQEVLRKYEKWDISHLSEPVLERLLREDARVTNAYVGIAGDPGVHWNFYLLCMGGLTFENMCKDRKAFARALKTVQRLQVSQCLHLGDGSAAAGWCYGLDASVLLPPCLPCGRGEDTLFALIHWMTDLRSLAAHLPFAPYHLRGEPRAFFDETQSVLIPGVVPSFSDLLFQLFHMVPNPSSEDVAERMRGLGRFLQDFCAVDLETFRGRVLELALRRASTFTLYLSRLLEERNAQPDFWAESVEAFIHHQQKLFEGTVDVIPLDWPERERGPKGCLQEMRDLMSRFGDLLVAWPEIFEIARNLKGGFKI